MHSSREGKEAGSSKDMHNDNCYSSAEQSDGSERSEVDRELLSTRKAINVPRDDEEGQWKTLQMK